MSTTRPILISFSGMDGAGKSTQIANLQSLCSQLGLSTRVLAFWDDVVVLSRYRERFARKVFKSESGIGAPGKPVNRRDKNVRGWHVNILRHGLYALDAINLRRVIARARYSGADVLIFDRYIYDELSNLPLERVLTRTFIRTTAKLVPQPDIAFVLDADPAAARERKPEYPLDFLYKVREFYLSLAHILGTLTVVQALSLIDAQRVVELAFRKVLSARAHAEGPVQTGAA
jgi:thymidylate kinase